MAITVSVYFTDEDLHTKVMEQRVTPSWGGKMSPYLVDLAKRDIAGAAPKVSGNKGILIELAKQAHPTLAAELEQQLLVGNGGKPVSQERVLALLLEALHFALKRDFDPEATFQLRSSEEVVFDTIRANPRLREFLTGGLRLDAPSAGETTDDEKKRAEKLYQDQLDAKKNRRGVRRKAKSPDASARAQ
jgi:hypothetical protein